MDSTENPHTDSVKTYRNWIQRSPMSPEKPVSSSRRDRNGGAEIFLKEVGEKPDPLLADEQIPSSLVAKTERPDSSINLPESYEMLDKLFHSLDDSIPLCRQIGSAATFSYVSPESRRFTVPEAMGIEKILVHEVHTSCMKPDLLLTLEEDIKAFEGSENAQFKSGNIPLTEIFGSCRVFKDHLQDDEIPEDAFKTANQANTTTIQDSSASIETPQTARLEKKPICHKSQALIKSFSQTSITKATEQEEIVASGGPSCSEMISKTQCSLPEIATPSPKKPIAIATPVKHTNSDIISGNTSFAASDCTPENLPHATPRLAPPKRCYMTPDNDDVAKPGNELGMRPQPCCKWRKIDYTIYKDLDDDTREKVAREHMIAGLPILIDVVFFLFQSTQIFFFTKDALLFKVMSVNLDLRSRKEAEEQIALLLEHAPEWIYEDKRAPPRRALLCIKKMIASPVEMCTRIMEAIKQDPIVNQGS